jgi:serine/threonine protein kinase
MAAYVVKQAANAVQYLHDLRAASARPVRAGHGELDPSNLFVTCHGTIKLFGVGLRPIRIANMSAPSTVHAMDSSSQEAASLASERIDGAADRQMDVFNLGVVLWTCLTGRSPQLAHGSGEVNAAAPQRMVAPSSLHADVPEALDAITMRALSPDPLERFQTARALSEALDRYLAGRDCRLTPKDVRRWLEPVFDAERASLQMQIAQGRDVEGALSLLGTAQRAGGGPSLAHPLASLRPRELWSTSHSLFSRLERGSIAPTRSFELGPGLAPHERSRVSSILPRHTLRAPTGTPASLISEQPTRAPPRARQPRPWMVGVMVAICVVIAIGTAVILSSSDESSPFRAASQDSPSADRSGRVDVRSSPEGAAVFVDGEPTGLYTPVVLKGLAAGREVLLRVDKAGFVSQARKIEIVGGSVTTQAFLLLASDGLVHFAGAPPNARIYIDDVAVAEIGKPVNLSVGPHVVRVETPSTLIFSGTVDIGAGEQTIRVEGAPATP